MKKYIYIAVGGSLGALSRYAIKNLDFSKVFSQFPINTLIINIAGSLIISFILTLASQKKKFSENLKLMLTTGFLGAFTTFSTLCKDSIGLIKKGSYSEAFMYIGLSLVLGMLAAYIGYKLCTSLMLGKAEQMEEEQAG